MDISAEISLEVNGTLVTARQLEALLAVQDTGSQSAAAKRLGISAPVLNKYISAISAAAGADVLKTTPAGSRLTLEGEEIASAARFMSLRCETNRQFTDMEKLDQEALDKLVAGGTEILPLTDEELQAYADLCRDKAWAKMAELVGQDVIDEIKKDLE